MSASRFNLNNLMVAVLFAAGFAILYRQWLFTGFDRVFGDNGDGLILLANVEHWHRVLTGQARWSDPNFFYPERGVLGFTDALFLYGLLHAPLRVLGFDTFTAFMLVTALLSIIGFFGFMRLAHRHFGIAIPWAALGAFLFVFANMNAYKLIHAQLYWAMLLPVLCDLVLTAWAEERRRRAAALAAIAGLLHGLIFFTAYLTGWFFAFFLLLFVLLLPVVFSLDRILELLRQAAAKWHVAISYAGGFAIGIVPFLRLYLPVRFSGRSRELSEVLSNAPNALDIINVTTDNLVWGKILHILGVTGRPLVADWEVEMGFTPTVFLALIATLVVLAVRVARRSTSERDRWLVLFGLAVVVSWLVQVEYFGFRPWTAIWAVVPGASGVRYTFRSQIVANLFAALVVVRGLAGLMDFLRARQLSPALAVAPAALMAVEQVNLLWPVTVSRTEFITLVNAIPPPPASCRVFYIAPGPGKDGWQRQADAMLISHIRGFSTVNGFSSWLPHGWDLEDPSKPGYAGAVRDWAKRNEITDGLCGLELETGQWTLGLPR